MNAVWQRGIEGDDPPQWIDLDERTQVNLCCDLIGEDDAWLFDSITDLPLPKCVEMLRAMNDCDLGRELRLVVMGMCKKEVERRLECGDFLP
jgi:hypothetical protein